MNKEGVILLREAKKEAERQVDALGKEMAGMISLVANDVMGIKKLKEINETSFSSGRVG